MCKVLGVSRSGYYRWLKNAQKELVFYKDLDQKIEYSFEQSRSNYGSPRIAQDLAKSGCIVSKSTVARRIKVLKIRARRRRKYVVTTDSKHDQPVATNILNRDFKAKKLAQKWFSDLTYFKIGKHWCYLSIIIDLADRAVVGWSISDNMTAQHTTVDTFKKAIKNRKPMPGMIFHSDRGIQYACRDFRDLLDYNKCIQSMSRKGNCWDNAVAESFFKTIKTECIDKYEFVNQAQAYSVIFDYIDGWYNTKRIHSTLGGRSPAEMFNLLKLKKTAV